MGMILCIAPSHIVGYGDIVDRSGGFKFKLSANSVMRGRVNAIRTFKGLVANLRLSMIIRIFALSVLAKPLNNAQIVRGVFVYTHLNMAILIPFTKRIESTQISSVDLKTKSKFFP